MKTKALHFMFIFGSGLLLSLPLSAQPLERVVIEEFKVDKSKCKINAYQWENHLKPLFFEKYDTVIENRDDISRLTYRLNSLNKNLTKDIDFLLEIRLSSPGESKMIVPDIGIIEVGFKSAAEAKKKLNLKIERQQIFVLEFVL